MVVGERERETLHTKKLVKDEQGIDIMGHTMCMGEARIGSCCRE
jgi:hypothetical protein